VVGTFPMQDKYGKSLGEQSVMRIGFDDVSVVQFDNVTVEDAADDLWVHPALQ
jgi:hypothetical protein